MFKNKFTKIKKRGRNDKLNGNLGYLSTYNIEDIYFFIGEQKVKEKIADFKNIPTMGIRLEDFIYNNGIMGDYRKGPIDCLTYLLGFFTEPYIVEYLFSKTHTFNFNNYMDNNSIWSNNRANTVNRLIKIYKKREVISNEKINKLQIHLNYNYYFIDYHFFLICLYRKLPIIKDDNLKVKINSLTLPHYIPKLPKIKESLIDMDFWTNDGLGNGILRPLMKYCDKTNQNKKYEKYFENAVNNQWRF